jgi:dolichol-phosphate mannosyltransferase
MAKTLVVVPTYLEAPNIEGFLRVLREAVPTADVLVVDDNSADGTADIVEGMAGEIGQIEVLRRPSKSGLGSAYRAGFTVGVERGYDVLVEIDADLSHDPYALPRLLEQVEAGADLAIGSRYVPGGSIPYWPAGRRAISRFGCWYSAFMLRLDVRDSTAGYRAYRADMLKAIDVAGTRTNGYCFQIENTYRVTRWGGRIVEVPIEFRDRERGSSKMSWRIAVEAMAYVTWWGLKDRIRARRAA